MPNPSKVTYTKADELKTIAEKFIPKYHPHLDEMKIAYLFRDRPINKGGKTVIASAEKCNGKTKFLSNFDFIITAHEEVWDMLNDKQKAAVVDHELSHCKIQEDDEGEITCKIVTHDFEDFYTIIERHNTVFEEIEKLAEIISTNKKKSKK